MPGKVQVRNAAPAPVPLLFFIADTGGGHRNAARAVSQALDRHHPGRFAPASGLSNDEISRESYVSASTAKTHAARAMTKLGARDRAQLVVFAYQAGLVRPGWAD